LDELHLAIDARKRKKE
jgi:hypothetical protein